MVDERDRNLFFDKFRVFIGGDPGMTVLHVLERYQQQWV